MNDFWLTAAAAGVVGGFSEFDEPEIGSRFLRGVFGNQNFVQAIASLGVAYRYSINRDLVKVGVYHDLAGYYESDFAAGSSRFRVANAFGLGVHALVFDLFQFDVYVGTGFASDGESGFGSTFQLQKAF
ncbi:MAG: hypothetical protein AAFQ82_10560 [Myxococcota bacterium]